MLSPVEEDFSDNDLADIFGKSKDEDDLQVSVISC